MTAAEDDLVDCDSCDKGVLPLFELRGDDAAEADVLCSDCLADDETTDTSEAGEVSDE